MLTSELPFYRRLYRRYLDRYSFFRLLKLLSLRAFYRTRNVLFFGRDFIASRCTRWLMSHPRLYDRWTKLRWWLIYFRRGGNYPLIPLSATNIKREVIQPEAFEIIDGPRFIKRPPDYVEIPSTVRLYQPALEICEYKNAAALAGSNIIVVDAKAVHSDLFVPERDVCHSERSGAIRISNRRVRYALDPPRHLDEAISLLGQCAGNYAHFLTEVLPRLAVIDTLPEYATIPIIVDAWMDAAHQDIVDLFNITNRPVVKGWIGQPIVCRRLIDISPVAYAPPEYRSLLEGGDFETPAPEVYRFNKRAFALLRERADQLVPEAAGWIGRKLYVSRRISNYGNARGVVNIDPIEVLLKKSGFDSIEPGALTPLDQIAAFREAKVVVAATGAALANLVFTKPGCKVFCLAAYFEGAEYCYWSNLMEALGHDLQFVVGPQVNKMGHPLHRNYRIPMSDIWDALQSIRTELPAFTDTGVSEHNPKGKAD